MMKGVRNIGDGAEKMNFSHKSVLLEEAVDGLAIKPDGIYVDATAGGGGHSFEIAKRLTDGGRLIAIDRDEDAISAATKRLSEFSDRVTIVKNNFVNIDEVLRDLGIDRVDGILIDLGVSSYQLDTAERGFSYNADAPLDMRMDRESSLSAYEVVNNYSEDELRRIIFEYGEERYASRIAERIVRLRQDKPISSTGELVKVIKDAMPREAKEGGHHPAKRTFQAIRIEVNGELSIIEPTIRKGVSMLKQGGRMAIITFHSLEDRLVKQTYASLASGCTCPRDFPICVCGKKPVLKQVNKKPILSGECELEENPRARSAKLRIAEKL